MFFKEPIGCMYTFLKFFTAVFLFLIVLVAGYFLIKWFTSPEYRIGELEQGRVLSFDFGGGKPAEDEVLRVLSYNIGFAGGPVQHTLADEHPESFYTANSGCDKFTRSGAHCPPLPNGCGYCAASR